MKRIRLVWITLSTILLFAAVASAEGPKESKASAGAKTTTAPATTPDAGPGTYVQVALWDVVPGKTQAFETAVGQQMSHLSSGADVINARLLKSLSDLNAQYVTYVRYQNVMSAEDSLSKQVAVLSAFCTRAPETHLIRLGHAYSRAGNSESPTGTEFAQGGTGQIAHLGLWVPYPRFQDAYDQVLNDVKVSTMNQHNPGYIGEETGYEARELSQEEQTPYSPHAVIPQAMSINYGEFKTFQSAEESFLAHQDDRNARSAMQIFFGSLQIPTRFYIYQVVQSYNYASSTVGQNHKSAVNPTEVAARR
jgi:hypothetical protein